MEQTFEIGQQLDLKSKKNRALEGIFLVCDANGDPFNFPSESTFGLIIWKLKSRIKLVEFTSTVSPSEIFENENGQVTWRPTNAQMNQHEGTYWYQCFYIKGDGDIVDITFGNYRIY